MFALRPVFWLPYAYFRQRPPEPHWLYRPRVYGRFYKIQGNLARAQGYLTKVLEIFERLGTLIEPDKIEKELDMLREAYKPWMARYTNYGLSNEIQNSAGFCKSAINLTY